MVSVLPLLESWTEGNCRSDENREETSRMEKTGSCEVVVLIVTCSVLVLVLYSASISELKIPLSLGSLVFLGGTYHPECL